MIPDTESISRILTLRYDPCKNSPRARLTECDFRPQKRLDNIESRIINIIKNDLIEKYRKLKFKDVSLALSSGIDSRLTLAMIRSFLPDVRVNCVCVGFGDKDDELDRAREIARTYDCDFNGLVLDDVLSELPKLIAIVKEPRWNLYHYYAFESGKKRSDLFYTGDGGDELFGGYTFRYHKFLSLLGKDTPIEWKEKARLYLSCHERDWVPDQDKLFGTAVKFSWQEIYSLFKSYFDNDLNPLDQVFLADFNGKLLYDWLPTNIAFSNFLKVSIESIFLTNNMIAFATHVPWQKKYDPQTQTGKIPLRSIMRKQKEYEKIEAAKKGFSIELVSMWNRNAREIVTTYVNGDAEIVKNRLISRKWVQRATESLSRGNVELNTRYISKMLSILALEIWYKLFVSKTMDRKQKL